MSLIYKKKWDGYMNRVTNQFDSLRALDAAFQEKADQGANLFLKDYSASTKRLKQLVKQKKSAPEPKKEEFNAHIQQEVQTLFRSLSRMDQLVQGMDEKAKSGVAQHMKNILSAVLTKEELEQFNSDEALIQAFFRELNNQQNFKKLMDKVLEGIHRQNAVEDKFQQLSDLSLSCLSDHADTITRISKNDSLNGALIALVEFFSSMLDHMSFQHDPEHSLMSTQTEKSPYIPMPV